MIENEFQNCGENYQRQVSNLLKGDFSCYARFSSIWLLLFEFLNPPLSKAYILCNFMA